jgi:hypothetical protein
MDFGMTLLLLARNNFGAQFTLHQGGAAWPAAAVLAGERGDKAQCCDEVQKREGFVVPAIQPSRTVIQTLQGPFQRGSENILLRNAEPIRSMVTIGAMAGDTFSVRFPCEWLSTNLGKWILRETPGLDKHMATQQADRWISTTLRASLRGSAHFTELADEGVPAWPNWQNTQP